MCLDKIIKRLRSERASFLKSRAACEENSMLNSEFIFKVFPFYSFTFVKFFPRFLNFKRKFGSRFFSRFFQKINVFINGDKNHRFVNSNCMSHNITSADTITKKYNFVKGFNYGFTKNEEN